MRILLYNRHFFPSIGGTEISGRIMARELVALGHGVTVVTATTLPTGVAELDEGYSIVRSERSDILVRLARASDVLISRGGVSLRAYLAAARAGLPFVAFQEFDATAGRIGDGFRRHVTDTVKHLVRRRARLIVGVSDALRIPLELPVGTDWFRLYNPVKEELWTAHPEGFAERDLDVLFVGRLVTDKGLLVLRDALLALPKRERLRVAIAGGGDDRLLWEDHFREVVGGVKFLGLIEGSPLRDLYARARVVVVSSLVNEGMGMVAAEALANGTPVCASDQPALREVVRDAGLFHPTGDATRLAEDIDRLLGDPRLWQMMSSRARVERVRFSMIQYRETLSDLMGKIAGEDGDKTSDKNKSAGIDKGEACDQVET